jgi:hypothetical protein
MTETIHINAGEKLVNETIENAIIKVTGSGVKLSTLKLINSKLECRQVFGLRTENIHIEGGVANHDESILVEGSEDSRFSDITCDGVQRSFNCQMNRLGAMCEIVIDGLYVRNHVQHMNDPNRKEAILFHGYPTAANPTLDLELRNFVVDDEWPGSPLTFWNANIKRALIKECANLPGRVQIGFSDVAGRVERLEIESVNSSSPGILWRSYNANLPNFGPSVKFAKNMIGDIKVPENWNHTLWLNGGTNPQVLGVYDTIEAMRDTLPEAM